MIYNDHSEYHRYSAFIQQALRDRREDVKETRIHRVFAYDLEPLFDRFVDLVCECGIQPGDTAWTLVDDRIINGQYGRYIDFVADFIGGEFYEKLRGTNPETRSQEDVEFIEEKMIAHGMEFDREHFTYHD